MNVVFVYNPHSGSALDKGELRKLVAKHNISIKALVELGPDSKKQLLNHITAGETIMVLGGDGTINSVGSMMVDTKAVLAPLPGGTLNHFTKDLGIPQDLNEALANLKRSSIHTIDVATVNTRVFLNNSSIGLYPSSLRTRSRLEDRFGKWPSAVFAVLRSFIKFRAYIVTVAGETFRTPFIFVGNNKYDINEPGVPRRDRLNQGILSVFITKTSSRFALLKITYLVLFGKAAQNNEVDMREVSTLTVRSRHKTIHVSFDGELTRMSTPLTYTLRPKSLRVRY